MKQEQKTYVNRVTEQDVEDAIRSVHYFTAAEACLNKVAKGLKNNDHSYADVVAESLDTLNTTTICVVVLKNGFSVVGTNAVVSPINWDAELAAKYSLEDAKRQIWCLLGYSLKSKLAE